MRAKPAEREQAIALRQQGLSYAEIQSRVSVSQSSLSLWLRHVSLSAAQKERLAELKRVGTSSGPRRLHEERVARMVTIQRKANIEARRLLRRMEVSWIIGTTLYWAEGSKLKPWASSRTVSFMNMDPQMLRLFRRWIMEYGGVNSTDLKYSLYIHPVGDVDNARAFWTQELGMSSSCLRIYYKRPNHAPRRRNTGKDYHGTMRIDVARSTSLLWRIEQWIRSLADVAGSANW